mgnify:CR=1 FL=1
MLCYDEARWHSQYNEGGRYREVKGREHRNDTMYGCRADDSRRIQHHDHFLDSEPNRSSGSAPSQDGVHVSEHVSCLSLGDGGGYASEQGCRADLHLVNN